MLTLRAIRPSEIVIVFRRRSCQACRPRYSVLFMPANTSLLQAALPRYEAKKATRSKVLLWKLVPRPAGGPPKDRPLLGLSQHTRDLGRGEKTHSRGSDEPGWPKARVRIHWIAASVARFLPMIRTSLPISPAYLMAMPSRLNSLGW